MQKLTVAPPRPGPHTYPPRKQSGNLDGRKPVVCFFMFLRMMWRGSCRAGSYPSLRLDFGHVTRRAGNFRAASAHGSGPTTAHDHRCQTLLEKFAKKKGCFYPKFTVLKGLNLKVWIKSLFIKKQIMIEIKGKVWFFEFY